MLKVTSITLLASFLAMSFFLNTDRNEIVKNIPSQENNIAKKSTQKSTSSIKKSHSNDPSASKVLKIYLDADRSRAKDSGIAIERGIKTALSEVNNKLFGLPVEIELCDHRGNSQRSKAHLEKFLEDSRALVVFSGLHSPPLLAHREYINHNGIIVLDPWAAAGPITRFPSKTNSIFRLSVDDWKAGPFIINYLIKEGYRKPYLLLENTGWGKSNEKSMNKALKGSKANLKGISWFNWNIKQSQTIEIYNKAFLSGADCVVLVSNATEGVYFTKYIASLPKEKRLPIFSHWGIVDSMFTAQVTREMRKKLKLLFIQTSFSFFNKGRNQHSIQVFEKAQSLFPTIQTPYDIKAPAGFIHGYDLTKILISACAQMRLTENMKENRKRLRDSLENISGPIKGLIKTYHHPFRPFSENDPDAHEALGIDDFSMAYFGEKDEIRLMTE